MRAPLRAALLALALPAAGRAQSAAGAESFEFLLLDANARAVAMGGAYTALATDGSALHYNPAGLARVRSNEAVFMHNQYAQGVTQQYMGVALKRGLGAQVNYATLGSVPQTTIGRPGGTGARFDASDMALGAGYGAALTPDLAAGAGVKFLQETLADVSATGWAADFGALYRVPDFKRLTLGASLLNAGPAIRFQRTSERLPTMARLGGAFDFRLPRSDVLLAADVSKTLLDKLRLGFGLETLIDQTFALRAGFTTREDAGLGLRFGLGWKGRSLGADYAFAPLGALGIAHRISLTLRWGGRDDPAQAEGPARYGTPEWYLARAQEAVEKGRLPAARTYLNAGLRMLGAGDRRRVRFNERLGSVLVLEKDFRAALQAYSDGVNLAYAQGYADESVADAYVGIGLCLSMAKNYEVAAKSFQKAIEIGPSPAAMQIARTHLKELSAAKTP